MVSCGVLTQNSSFPLEMAVDQLKEEALHDALEMFGGADDTRDLTTCLSGVIGQSEANKVEDIVDGFPLEIVEYFIARKNAHR